MELAEASRRATRTRPLSRSLIKRWSSGIDADGVGWRRARTNEASDQHAGFHRSREPYSGESSAADDQRVCGRGIGGALAGVRSAVRRRWARATVDSARTVTEGESADERVFGAERARLLRGTRL